MRVLLFGLGLFALVGCQSELPPLTYVEPTFSYIRHSTVSPRVAAVERREAVAAVVTE